MSGICHLDLDAIDLDLGRWRNPATVKRLIEWSLCNAHRR
jgi:hypothetical protein